MSRRARLGELELHPGETRLPDNFAERLTALKQRSGLSWEAIAAALGGTAGSCCAGAAAPSGGAMLPLCRPALRGTGGLSELLDVESPARTRSGGWGGEPAAGMELSAGATRVPARLPSAPGRLRRDSGLSGRTPAREPTKRGLFWLNAASCWTAPMCSPASTRR